MTLSHRRPQLLAGWLKHAAVNGIQHHYTGRPVHSGQPTDGSFMTPSVRPSSQRVECRQSPHPSLDSVASITTKIYDLRFYRTMHCKTRFCHRILSVCLSIRLSVHPSVTLVDCDHNHIGWKSRKLTGVVARTIIPTPSLFVAQRPSI